MIDATDTPDRKAAVRQSEAGSKLTQSQFDEFWAVAGIMARHVHKTDVFRDKLTKYADTLASGERLNELKAEEIIRDVFKARYGETMNEMRERLQARALEIHPGIADDSLRHARSVIDMIREQPTMPFYRAYDNAACTMAETHGITETAAKVMMKRDYAVAEKRSLYEAGKEAEALYHAPMRQKAEDTERQSEKRSRKPQQNWS